uniref:Protein CLEC16A-like n=1 Tax=Phallusia mammillata TaxID=59560 RepID=A0A6F9D9N9_9ASCI|nr:protein CLEC16A-like [Phallusia mammillata]
MQRRGWLGGPKPPKNPHSLEHLRYLHHVLTKNHTITENNKSLIVEALRSMSEILIWGDQNDSSVFEFYLEKNMFLFFLNILQQNSGNYVCVQLLQTLNILFENLQHETSLYYLLSNNHVNDVICHKFDFSDEEVMAYYISFLKTLSLRLNEHTIHFFYNEHTDDFALYTEGIKFFNHSETMVRIAVRTLTLNVYKVNDHAMLRFIQDKTAAPYFSNLVWFIAEHVRQVDACVRANVNHQQSDRLRDIVAEHLDHLHYLNDIVTLENNMLNKVLIDHLLHRLFFPLYVRSLADGAPGDDNEKPLVNSVTALFLLSQVFLIIHHETLVHQLAEVIFTKNLESLFITSPIEHKELLQQPESLEKLLSSRKLRKKTKNKKRPNFRNLGSDEEIEIKSSPEPDAEALPVGVSSEFFQRQLSIAASQTASSGSSLEASLGSISPESHLDRPFLDTIYSALNCTENDYTAIFALCLLYAMLQNKGISCELKRIVQLGMGEEEKRNESYCHWLIERLLRIISKAVKPDSKIRLATLRLTVILLKKLGMKNGECVLPEHHLTCVEQSRNESMQNLQKCLQEEEMFLDIFEDEYRTFMNKPFNVEYLMMDSSLLLPPTVTPLTGIEFTKRLPCGPTEQIRRSIGVFLALRDVSLTFCKEVETQLPLTREQDCIQTDDKLDLNNSDLIACTVVGKDSKNRRFLVVDLYQLILVEPDNKRLGWGVVKFSGFLQDVEVSSDPDDSRTLHVTIHKPSGTRRVPMLAANFVFDDHIRCMAAKQRLTKGRMRARHLKTRRIAVLLGVSPDAHDDPFSSSYLLNSGYQAPRSQFRAFAEPQVLRTDAQRPGVALNQRDLSRTPTARVHPLLKRPGHAASRVSPVKSGGRIGNLGLPLLSSPSRASSSCSSSSDEKPTSSDGDVIEVSAEVPDESRESTPKPEIVVESNPEVTSVEVVTSSEDSRSDDNEEVNAKMVPDDVAVEVTQNETETETSRSASINEIARE